MIEKSPTRLAIEAEVVDAMLAADGPMTAAELLSVCTTGFDGADMSRVLYLMRKEGVIENAEPRESVKSRPKLTWALSASKARDTAAKRLIAALQTNTKPTEDAMSTDQVALRKMTAAEDDDGEACLDLSTMPPVAPIGGRTGTEARFDRAADSMGGDEFAHPLGSELAMAEREWQLDLLNASMDADAAMLDLAHALLKGDPVWDSATRMHKGISRLAKTYA